MKTKQQDILKTRDLAVALVIAAVAISVIIQPTSKKTQPKPFSNFTEIVAGFGYAVEEHVAVTEDGYLLTMFRMTGKDCKQRKKPPVLLMHGMLLSSDIFLDVGPEGLPYLLADACYDLWVGNNRGNYYSRGHLNLDPDSDSEYWQFTFQELGVYDIPAMVDYILNQTTVERVNYIGYSQGATIAYVMCSERPEYCQKMRAFVALGPQAQLYHSRSRLLRLVCYIADTFQSIFTYMVKLEIMSKGSFVQEVLESFCELSELSSNICRIVIVALDTYHPEAVSTQTVSVMFRHLPAGASLKNLIHISQCFNRMGFVKFDHGKQKNLVVYGSESPPAYDLSAVSVPNAVFYALNDHMTTLVDTEWLLDRLPNATAVQIDDPEFTHLDMVYSKQVKQQVFSKLHEYLLGFSY